MKERERHRGLNGEEEAEEKKRHRGAQNSRMVDATKLFLLSISPLIPFWSKEL